MLFTIDKAAQVSIKIQRSEFIAFLYPIEQHDDAASMVEQHTDAAQMVASAKEQFSRHNTEYQNATHNCYAYVIGKKQEWQYYSDQGEPSGTAGKPILNTLLKHNLTNVLAVVTRYYGGVKLGVRGLIDAYSESVEAAISQSDVVEYIAKANLQIECDYTILDSLKHFLGLHSAELLVKEYGSKVIAEIIYPEAEAALMRDFISDLTIKGHVQRLNL